MTSDDVHLAYALEQQRVGGQIVTNDPDFLVLAQQGMPHMGIASMAIRERRSMGEVIRRLIQL